MKVIQILPELHAGGVERGTLEIARHLAQHGHQAWVISNGGRLVEALEAAGGRHVAMPVHRKSPASLRQVRPLRRLLEAERPDILHIRSRVPGWLAYLAWRGLDPATRPRLVSTFHGFYSVNRYSAIMTRGERVIAVSHCIRDHILARYPSTPPDRIRVIHRGIDPGHFHPGYAPDPAWLARWHAEHPDTAGRKLLLLAGRITRLKGHEDFFHLIAALKSEGVPAFGLIAGDTHPKKRAYLAELEALARRLGLDGDLAFLGHRSDLREIMSLSDLVCSLSQQPESFGRTVLEAMALGKPVVGYDCGGVGELLDACFPPGKVPVRDAATLSQRAHAILRGACPPPTTGDRFTLEAMCRGTVAVYDELLASGR